MIDIHAILPKNLSHQPPSEPLDSVATAINSHNQVVGWYEPDTTGGKKRAFLWLPEPAYHLDPGVHDLNMLFEIDDGPYQSNQVASMALSINDSGQIAGVYDFASAYPKLPEEHTTDGRAIVWDLATNDPLTPYPPDYIDISVIADGVNPPVGLASDISNDNPPIVVGWLDFSVECEPCGTETGPQPVHHAYHVALDQSPTIEFMSDIGSTMWYTFAHAIAPTVSNNVMRVVGDTYFSGAVDQKCEGAASLPYCRPLGLSLCNQHFPGDPLLWEIEGAIIAPTVLDKITQTQFLRQHWAVDINASSHMIGRGGIHIDPASECTSPRALFWEDKTAGHVVLEPPAPGQEEDAEATALTNPDGEDFVFVVGNNMSTFRAVLWRWDDPTDPEEWTAFLLEDYTEYGCPLWAALDINDNLWIVGWGQQTGSFNNRAYILTTLADLPCSADLNGDGCVGPDDKRIMLGAWEFEGCHPADLNNDGIVDEDDMAILIDQWCSKECGCPNNPDICPSETLQQSVKEGDFMPLFIALIAEGEEKLAYEMMDTVGWPE